MSEDWITALEVGEKIRLTPDTILLLARRGRIPCYRMGRRIIRFRLHEVIASLEAAPSQGLIPDPNPGSNCLPTAAGGHTPT